MNTKLTLTIEKEIIDKAKEYAKTKKRSLSDIIENYLMLITQEDSEVKNQPRNSTVDSLKGSFKMSEEFDYKKELGKRLQKKYL